MLYTVRTEICIVDFSEWRKAKRTLLSLKSGFSARSNDKIRSEIDWSLIQDLEKKNHGEDDQVSQLVTTTTTEALVTPTEALITTTTPFDSGAHFTTTKVTSLFSLCI
ncbi:hypothetical protein N665_0131s0027 [Sinapis alba]|nr:hypothetical protein N665_0131s0027 [Sinapis alba]